MKQSTRIITLFSAYGALVPAEAATTLYADRTTFLNSLSIVETEDYSGYASGLYSDSQIDTLLGATTPVHRTTGGTGSNQIFQNTFNASNTSFLITFTNTVVGTVDGVYGVAFDYGQLNAEMDVFVTFANATTQNYVLSATPSPFSTPDFFGVTSDDLIESIHVSLPVNNAGITSSAFVFDNLSYGSNVVPEPSTGLLSMMALSSLGLRRRRS